MLFNNIKIYDDVPRDLPLVRIEAIGKTFKDENSTMSVCLPFYGDIERTEQECDLEDQREINNMSLEELYAQADLLMKQYKSINNRPMGYLCDKYNAYLLQRAKKLGWPYNCVARRVKDK